MPIVQQIDRKKYIQSHPIYKGSSVVEDAAPLVGRALQDAPTERSSISNPLINHQIYLSKSVGGAFDLGGIFNFVKENKDLISNTVGDVTSAAKSISDTIKASKELEKIKIKNKNKKEYQLSPDQLKALNELRPTTTGSGFVKF